MLPFPRILVVGLLPLLAVVSTATGDSAPINPTMPMRLSEVSVADLCRVLEARTGAKHRAKDTPTADLLATAYGDFEPAEFRQALGEALGLTWTAKDEEGVKSYVVEPPGGTTPGRLARGPPSASA